MAEAELLDKLTNFESTVLRNITGYKSDLSEFNDLSDEPNDWKKAQALSKENFSQKLNKNNMAYEAIEYIFDQDSWLPSRFSDGSFPVWYGSLELDTTFFETGFHWKYTLLADAGFLKKEFSIYAIRTVFKTECVSPLIDLREKAKDYPFLIQPNVNQYQQTQTLGLKLSKGFPGLITLSARKPSGINVAVFNKIILQNPKHYSDYLYEISPDNSQQIKISHLKTRDLIMTI